MRASAQTLSYEVFLGLSLMGCGAQADSFNMRRHRRILRRIPVEHHSAVLWFLYLFIAGVAVSHRHPFDQPEAEQELADGYHIEYSGMKLGHVLRR